MEKTPSSLLNAELLATCGALGWSESGRYHKNPECLDSLKDLIRYLRRDDESHEVRRQLGSIGVVETDLLPLVKNYGQDKDIFDVALRLLVNLTNPAIILFKEELPEEKMSRNFYQECVVHLQDLKRAFADSRLWTLFSDKLRSLLEQDWEKKEEDDDTVIERVLILVRNVLHIPSNPEEEMRTDDDVSIHDQVIWALHTSGMTDIVLYIAANEEAESFTFHVIEILFHMLREQEPEQLASAGQGRAQAQKEKDAQVLCDLRAREKAAQRLSAVKHSRHPRFGGSFCVTNVKGIGENSLIVHRSVETLNSLNFDLNKKVRKVPKNRRAAEECQLTRRSTLNIRLVLGDFCRDFLDNAYNTFMARVKEHLTKHRAQDHDETYYMWAMRFFMELCRLGHLDISRVSETVSKNSYHYVHTQIENYCEMMITDKKAVHRWAKRTHLALRAYKEMVLTLASMMASKDKKISDSGKVIAGTIFYVMEYRDLLLHLLTIYDPQKFPRSFLRDLVEANHVFLKALEQFCGQHRHVIVQQKKKKGHKKKKEKHGGSKKDDDAENRDPALREGQWEELADDLSRLLQGGKEELPTEVTPFDAASEKSFEDQKTDALIQIQDGLRERRLGHSVSLLRASRDLWPEGEVFGAPNSRPEIEFLLLREIFFTDLPRPDVQTENQQQQQGEEPAKEDEEDDEETQEESQPLEMKISEQEFNFDEFLKRFARPKVVQAYCVLLSHYQENSSQTNHCLLKMMHRVAWDQKMHGLFFQASLFRTFQKILADPARATSSLIKELSRFSIFILRKFFETAEKNKKVFMEMLFWKNPKEVYEVQEGYGAPPKGKGGKVSWTEEEEEELKALFERFEGVTENGLDAIDLTQRNLSNQSRTRRQILCHLKHLDLIKDAKEYKKKSVNLKVSQVWSEEEVEKLRELFEKFRSSMDIMGHIFEGLQMKRTKNSIAKKLLELGLVTDRKQLHKKRSRKHQIGSEALHKDSMENESGDSDRSHSSSDSDSEEEESDGDGRPLGALVSPSAAPSTLPPALPPQKGRKGSSSSRRSSKNLNFGELKSCFDDVLSQGLLGGVEWLRESLESAAEDREDDDEWEALPLVPFLEEQSCAMANPQFMALLKALGIAPPANEQETFWRIPRNLSPAQLRARLDVLHQVEHSAPSSQHHPNATPQDQPQGGSVEPAEGVTGEPMRKRKRLAVHSDSEEGEDDLPLSAHATSTAEETIARTKGETAEFNSPQTAGSTEENEEQVQRKRVRKARFIVDEEENDDDAASSDKDVDANVSHRNLTEPMGSPGVKPLDSEEEDTQSSAPRKKRLRMIESDEEEDS